MRPPEFTGGNCRALARAVDQRYCASMRPPEFTGGNTAGPELDSAAVDRASMRPPEFTGGNRPDGRRPRGRVHASMRPPEFTGGNDLTPGDVQAILPSRFNEAAGIHRRKRDLQVRRVTGAERGDSFNEAAGIHRRKRGELATSTPGHILGASMRPPEFTGGNTWRRGSRAPGTSCFNEAAGIHRRKRVGVHELA